MPDSNPQREYAFLVYLLTTSACQASVTMGSTGTLLGCVEDTAPPATPEICDGTDDIRLVFANWSSAGSGQEVDYVMYAEGMYFLKIDGKCNFYLYNGAKPPALFWTPVLSGTLSDSELAELLVELDVKRWTSYPKFDSKPDYDDHGQWDLFELAGKKYGCPEGCAVSSALFETRLAGIAAVERLSLSGSPVTPTTLEVSVTQSFTTRPFAVDWGANGTLAEYDDDIYVVLLSGDPSDIGTFISTEDEPWFKEVADEYQALGVAGSIGIRNNDGDTPFQLYIRTVVP